MALSNRILQFGTFIPLINRKVEMDSFESLQNETLSYRQIIHLIRTVGLACALYELSIYMPINIFTWK